MQDEQLQLIPAVAMRNLVARCFAAAGSQPAEAEAIARDLVASNLAGHESHGVVRLPLYLDWCRAGVVVPNRSGSVLREDGPVIVLDGEYGYGQVIGARAVALGVARARMAGVALVATRRSGHLGRIGGWAELAAAEGLVSLHFVNSPGASGIQVAPHGARERRLSPNPLAIGVPRDGAPPLILDITTSVVPAGKVRVALHRGELLPEGAMLDAAGLPSRDPAAYYGPPPGALLPIAGHKGAGLCLMVDLLAGALTAGGCSDPRRLGQGSNNMLSIFIDPARLGVVETLGLDAAALCNWVKSAAPITPGDAVLVPGEREARLTERRRRDGIPLDPRSLEAITCAARSLGVEPSL